MTQFLFSAEGRTQGFRHSTRALCQPSYIPVIIIVGGVCVCAHMGCTLHLWVWGSQGLVWGVFP